MFHNIGRKVQTLSKVLCWFGIIISVIMGLLMIFGSNMRYNGVSLNGSANIIAGVLIIIIGCLGSWIGSWVTYAIGEAAEYAENHK